MIRSNEPSRRAATKPVGATRCGTGGRFAGGGDHKCRCGNKQIRYAVPSRPPASLPCKFRPAGDLQLPKSAKDNLSFLAHLRSLLAPLAIVLATLPPHESSLHNMLI